MVDIVQEIEFTFGVVCNVCGRDLEATFSRDEIIIDPCEYCLDKAREEMED
jgi:hypothetical protein